MADKGISVISHNGEDYNINDPNIAGEFYPNSNYAVGDHVTHEGKLYVFTAAHTGAWTGTDVTQVQIGAELHDYGAHAMVRYDVAQTLTDAQKTVARNNIGAASGSVVSEQGLFLSNLSAAVGTVPTGETVEDQITDLKSAITDITGNTNIAFSDPSLKQYIDTSGSTVSWDTPSVSTGTTGIKWAVLECSPGDVFVINGKGGNSNRLWAFAKANKDIITTARASANATASNLKLIAPNDSKYLILNDESNSKSYIGEFLVDKVSGIADEIDDLSGEIVSKDQEIKNDIGYITGNEYLSFSDPSLKQYINTSGNTVSWDTPSVASSNVKWCVVSCTENDEFVINGKGGNSNRLWAFAKANKDIITTARASANATATNLVIIAPHDAAYLIVNDESDSQSYKTRLVKNRLGTIEEELMSVDVEWENGSFSTSTGEITKVSNRCVSNYIPVSKGSKARFYPNGQYVIVGFFNFDMTEFSLIINDWYDKYYEADITNDGYLIVQVRKTTLNPPISPNEVLISLSIFQSVNNVAKFALANGSVGLTRDIPKNQGIRNSYKKALQFENVKWTALSAIPSVNSATGIQAGNCKGLPYSSVKEYDKFVGFDVSLRTFMTAAHNPYSLLYTEDIRGSRSTSQYGITYHGDNCGAYFGIVCNVFVFYSLGSIIPWNTAELDYLSRINFIEKIYNQSASGVELMDILWEPGHGSMILDIYRDNRGNPLKIFVAESTHNFPILREYTPASFNTRMQNSDGILYRYTDVYKNLLYIPSVFVPVEGETEQTYEYNDDVCTFAGDYAAFREGEEIWINYNLGETEYTGLSVYSGETLVASYSLSSGHKISIGNSLAAGKYTAVLIGNGTSDPTHFEVIETDVSMTNNSGEITVQFSSMNGTAIYAQMTYLDGSSRGIIPIPADSNGTITFNANTVLQAQYPGETFANTTYLKVFFKGDYGTVRNELIDMELT